ncbi:hypothetical protein VDG1235_1644 [Verrucomicrobiia bacterium DG1235]|nr:hypothetical protein VDG1235_1644 [Verrucomicrobiae bacterium DG1235]
MKRESGERDGPWRMEEQIGFECALARDEREEWQVLRERDGSLKIPADLWEGRKYRIIARKWLGERLKQDPSIKLASDSLGQSLGVAAQLLGVGGGLLGVALATGALAYTGAAPVNVSAFFFVFVLLQALFACLLLFPFLLPRSLKEGLVGSPLFRFARFVFGFAFEKTQALASRFLEGRKRHDAAEIVGMVRSRLALHKDVVKWLSFRMAQGTALCFNLGALAALLAAVIFSDRAFGWQTTLNVSTESIHTIVAFFASPWAWFYGEGLGYPDLAQIEGSRIVLKEGIRTLATSDLSAWWRFLALGMVTYGVLPRLVFWGLGHLQTRAALRRYDFGNASAQRLFERLRPASVNFEGEDLEQASSLSSESEQEELRVKGLSATQRLCCLFSGELAEAFDVVALRAALARRWNVPEVNIEMRISEGGVLFPESGFEAEVGVQYALVFESWMPPIKEVERQIKALRERLDERDLIKLVLLGIPGSGEHAISLHPEQQYREVWDRFTRSQGDPYLILDNPS